ncbi:MAG TPA: type II toxin-antitoxin system VapC family toxin [Acidimicrobiales bacterium]|nr:type II toxin-antitoxin system VapC family toxin [Acidimicrobiales bacterium]
MIVVDASVVVAALIDGGDDGRWSRERLTGGGLAAPHLLPVEVANVLRRAANGGRISDDVAALAHGEMRALAVELFPYELVADRVWALRSSVTTYDAWYVALAELLELPLATLDRRLRGAAGPTCQFLVPGDGSA